MTKKLPVNAQTPDLQSIPSRSKTSYRAPVPDLNLDFGPLETRMIQQMTTFMEARQQAFDKAAKAILEGNPSNLLDGVGILERNIVEAMEYVRLRYDDVDERRSKLIVLAAVEGLNTKVLGEP